ncbi:MAG: ornithine cyclodeaminase family protein, partial [Anaerolineaceae bacterium]|nr:ornithine cyclodeaminase family protein [Anaerolineaceae bacterium]
MQKPASLIYLTEDDVQKSMTIAHAVKLAEKGIQADSCGDVAGDKFYMPAGLAGDSFIKPFAGYLKGEEFAFVKTFSYNPDNMEDFDLPVTSSVILLFDVQNGLPVCIMEGNWVTGLRTAASTTVTAKVLARRNSEVITIIGAGLQGSMHMCAMAEGFDLRKANIIDISPEAASKLVARFEAKLEFPIKPISIEQREEAIRESDIILTVTTGNQPLVEYPWLKPGVFLAKLGSYGEIAPDIILEADKVIVDDWRYVSPRIPELKELIQSGSFNVENIHAEW